MATDSAISRTDSVDFLTSQYAIKHLRQDSGIGGVHPAVVRRNSTEEIRQIYASLPVTTTGIRLCQILPKFGDRVEVTLTGHSLDDEPRRYTALSYPWGDFDEKAKNFITVNGESFEVTRNLLTLLRRLRSRGISNVWVDAISIDQLDDEEKASQVCLMGAVFSKATTVYLGLDELGTSLTEAPAAHALVKKTLENLAKHPEMHVHEFGCLLVPDGDVESRTGSHLLLRLLRSAWSFRSWIVQEVCLARSPVLMCIWGLMPWRTFSDALKHWNVHYQKECCRIEDMQDDLKEALYRAYNFVCSIDSVRDKVEGRHILESIIQFLPLSATDPRDKFNAFRGLHTVVTRLPLPNPDYTSPVSLCFEEDTAWMIQEEQSLLPLALELQHKTRNTRWPSWVADFAAKLDLHENFWKARLSFYNQFICGPEIEWHCEHVAGSGKLVIRGAPIDAVHAVSDEFFDFPKHPNSWDPHHHFELLKRLSAFAADQDESAIAVDWPRMDEFAATMLGGCVWSDDVRVNRARESDQAEWKSLLLRLVEPNPDFDAFRDHPLIRSHHTSILRRRLVRTTNQALCIAPLSARAADFVVALGGGRLPFVIRPVPGSTDIPEYEMIGTCYLPAWVEGISSFPVGPTQLYALV